MSWESDARLLYRSELLVVANKPAGMPTHKLARPAAAAPVSLLQAVRDEVGRWVYPAHRLDAATSGAVAFGLSPETGRELSRLFAERRVAKTYVAVVRGHLPPAGTIDRPLVNHTTGATQAAVTQFRTLAQVELPWAVGRYQTARYTLVELKPETGRTHQLRRHLAGVAHPIVGDTRFGDGAHNRAMAAHGGVRRLLLHATSLAFPGPYPALVEAPLDTLMAGAVALFSAQFKREKEPSPCTTLASSSSPGP